MATAETSRAGSVRDRNRRELTRAIVDEARRQLATQGAAGLSLRSVSRELGMSSSAVYRYVASRDELLSLLIVEAYNALATAVERAVTNAAAGDPPARFRAFAVALRRWALSHPYEYALVYGSPVPGYVGNDETTRAASRVTALLATLLREAAAGRESATARESAAGLAVAGGKSAARETVAGGKSAARKAPRPTASQDLVPPTILWPELDAMLAGPIFADADGRPADIPRAVLIRGLMAWVELFGLVSFELFGQFANTIERTDQLYLHAVNVLIGDLF